MGQSASAAACCCCYQTLDESTGGTEEPLLPYQLREVKKPVVQSYKPELGDVIGANENITSADVSYKIEITKGTNMKVKEILEAGDIVVYNKRWTTPHMIGAADLSKISKKTEDVDSSEVIELKQEWANWYERIYNEMGGQVSKNKKGEMTAKKPKNSGAVGMETEFPSDWPEGFTHAVLWSTKEQPLKTLCAYSLEKYGKESVVYMTPKKQSVKQISYAQVLMRTPQNKSGITLAVDKKGKRFVYTEKKKLKARKGELTDSEKMCLNAMEKFDPKTFVPHDEDEDEYYKNT